MEIEYYISLCISSVPLFEAVTMLTLREGIMHTQMHILQVALSQPLTKLSDRVSNLVMHSKYAME